MFAKMNRLGLSSEWVLALMVSDGGWEPWYIDLARRECTRKRPADRPMLTCRSESNYLVALLTGNTHWNNAMISFNLRWHRLPDVYDRPLFGRDALLSRSERQSGRYPRSDGGWRGQPTRRPTGRPWHFSFSKRLNGTITSCPKTQTNSRPVRRAVSIVIAPWRASDLGRVGGDVGDSGFPRTWQGNTVQKRDATLPGRRPRSRSWAKMDIKEARAAPGPERG